MASDAEPLIPFPSKVWRWRLLVLLAVWQVGQFWVFEICRELRKALNFAPAVAPGEPDYRLDLFDLVYVAAYQAMALALAGNLALVLAKGRMGFLPRLIVALLLWSGAVAGIMFPHDVGVLIEMPIRWSAESIVGMFACGACWGLLPGLRRSRLILLHEPAEPPPESRYLRLAHFFYLLLGAAALSMAWRHFPEARQWPRFLEYVTVSTVASSSLVVGTCILGVMVHPLALSRGYGVYWLPLVILPATGAAFVQSFLVKQFSPSPEMDFFPIYFRINLQLYCLLVGSGLALRFLGYRLVRV